MNVDFRKVIIPGEIEALWKLNHIAFESFPADLFDAEEWAEYEAYRMDYVFASPTRVDQGGIKAAGLARAAPLVSHVAGREGNWSGSAEGTDAALDYCDVAGRLWSWSSRSETGGECHGRKRSFAMNSLNGLLTDCVEA